MILSRIYVNDINTATAFYEHLTNEKVASRFEMKDLRLTISRINNFLLIGGSDEDLISIKNVTASLLVDSIKEYKAFLLQEGATILKDIQQVPTGFNMTVKHKDGNIFEYVEHKQ